MSAAGGRFKERVVEIKEGKSVGTEYKFDVGAVIAVLKDVVQRCADNGDLTAKEALRVVETEMSGHKGKTGGVIKILDGENGTFLLDFTCVPECVHGDRATFAQKLAHRVNKLVNSALRQEGAWGKIAADLLGLCPQATTLISSTDVIEKAEVGEIGEERKKEDGESAKGSEGCTPWEDKRYGNA